MDKNIDEVELVIFDTETTGLSYASGDRIVELSGIKFRGQERISEFDVLVNSGRAVSPGAFAVNKITPEMLKNAPSIETVIPKFLDFIKGSCLCFYNAEFDLGFLNNELVLSGYPPIRDLSVLDILTMARKMLPGLPRYALWFVAQTLGIKSAQSHRAFSDAEMAREVFCRLEEVCRGKGIFSFTDFLTLFSFEGAFSAQGEPGNSGLIQAHIRTQEILKFKYLSSRSGEISWREVLPRQIKRIDKYWYLIGDCYPERERRTFRLDNILSFEESGKI